MKKIFRLFVSSTFNDLVAERNALHRYVFPRLNTLCRRYGCRFQAIDLRWGIGEEAALDHQTMKICFQEIARCQSLTPRPNFLILLGERYGWKPLPDTILATDFAKILRAVPAQDRDLLASWYQLDENAEPHEYLLRKRAGDYLDHAAWALCEAQLHRILEGATEQALPDMGGRTRYGASATHQEILNALGAAGDAGQSVFCISRTITNLGSALRDARTGSSTVLQYVDCDEDGRFDEKAHARLAELKNGLRRELGERFVELAAQFNGDGLGLDHLGCLPEDADEPEKAQIHAADLSTLCGAAWDLLARSIRRELAGLDEADDLDGEMAQHQAFAADRSRHFIGHDASVATAVAFATGGVSDGSSFLSRSLAWLRGGPKGQEEHRAGEGEQPDHRVPLLVTGPAGIGKSAFMAHVGEVLHSRTRRCLLVRRHIGATPDSTEIHLLLHSVSEQIIRDCDLSLSIAAPSEFGEVVQVFQDALRLAGQKREIILILDGLDQLSRSYRPELLQWLGIPLPPGARIILSARKGGYSESLGKVLPAANIVELAALDALAASRLLDSWLAAAGRTLTGAQKEAVLHGYGATPIPLYLKLAFEHCARWHSFTPPKDLDNGLDGIIGMLVERILVECGHEPTMVRRVLSYLACSRFGLTESELLEILARDASVYTAFISSTHHLPPDLQIALEGGAYGAGHKQTDTSSLAQKDRITLLNLIRELVAQGAALQLPFVLWSRLQEDLSSLLVERISEGEPVHTFYHIDIAAIISTKYIDAKESHSIHVALADYFESLAKDASASVESFMIATMLADVASAQTPRLQSRALVEIPWQLAAAGEYERLQDFLKNSANLYALWKRNPFEVRQYWSTIEENSPYRLNTVYAEVIREPQKHIQVADMVYSLLLSRGGYEQDAISINANMAEAVDSQQMKLMSLTRKANVLLEQGNYEEAWRISLETGKVAKDNGLHVIEADSLYLQSQATFHRGDYPASLELIELEEAIEREIGEERRLHQCLKWKAGILKAMNRIPEAMVLYPHLLQWYEENEDLDGLAACLYENATLALLHQNDFDLAISLLGRTEEILSKLGKRHWLKQFYLTAARMYFMIENHREAVRLYESHKKMCRELNIGDDMTQFDVADYVISLATTERCRDAYELSLLEQETVQGQCDGQALMKLIGAELMAVTRLLPALKCGMPYTEYRELVAINNEQYDVYTALLQKNEQMQATNTSDNELLVMARKVKDKLRERDRNS